MNKTLLASLCALPVVLPLVGCVQQDDSPDNIDKAIPTSDQVAIHLNTANRAAVQRTAGQENLGGLATWYVATRDVTVLFNGGSTIVLDIIHKIVSNPVTSTNGNVFTWGPWTDGALGPAEYKLEVTAPGDGTFSYVLSGRSKLTANSQFEAVVTGTADPRNGEAKGTGGFRLDFDAGRRVNPVDASDAKGSIEAHYDLSKKHLDLAIQSTDALGQPLAGSYAYDEASDGGGQLLFTISANAGGGAANESIALRSRWKADSSGRADARISGGDLASLTATASECWDTSFQQIYYIDALSNGGTLSASEGQESACAFTSADLPQ